jgi:hypothetical protein
MLGRAASLLGAHVRVAELVSRGYSGRFPRVYRGSIGPGQSPSKLSAGSDVVGIPLPAILGFGVSHVRICADHSALPAR